MNRGRSNAPITDSGWLCTLNIVRCIYHVLVLETSELPANLDDFASSHSGDLVWVEDEYHLHYR